MGRTTGRAKTGPTGSPSLTYMTMARRILLAPCLVLLCGASAFAEVRFVEGRAGSPPGVQVLPTLQGPWTPLGLRSPRHHVVNPQGDALGHGWPAWAIGPDGPLVAWVDPVAGRLVTVAGTRRGPVERALVAARPTGVPRVAPIALQSAAWLVTWQDGDAVMGAALDAEGSPLSTTLLGAGSLADLLVQSPRADALVVGMDGQVTLARLVFSTLPTPSPLPPIDIFGVQSVVLEAGEVRPHETVAGVQALETRPRLHAIRGQDVTVATWWPTPHRVRWAVIDAQGEVAGEGSVQGKGGADYSPSLLNQALREAAASH